MEILRRIESMRRNHGAAAGKIAWENASGNFRYWRICGRSFLACARQKKIPAAAARRPGLAERLTVGFRLSYPPDFLQLCNGCL
jgi:hypothetical protein